MRIHTHMQAITHIVWCRQALGPIMPCARRQHDEMTSPFPSWGRDLVCNSIYRSPDLITDAAAAVCIPSKNATGAWHIFTMRGHFSCACFKKKWVCVAPTSLNITRTERWERREAARSPCLLDIFMTLKLLERPKERQNQHTETSRWDFFYY